MTSEHKKPGMAFWMTVALAVMFVTYPLSFGPACWMACGDVIPVTETARFYRPLVRTARSDFKYPASVLDWYARLGTADADPVYRLTVYLDSYDMESDS